MPVIENIHQKVYEAASRPNALNMGDWHTCETTHCRFGWVEHLAGPAGAELAKKTSVLFAGMQIYNASSDIKVSPVMAFVDNHTSMEDMSDKRIITGIIPVGVLNSDGEILMPGAFKPEFKVEVDEKTYNEIVNGAPVSVGYHYEPGGYYDKSGQFHCMEISICPNRKL